MTIKRSDDYTQRRVLILPIASECQWKSDLELPSNAQPGLHL